jgi:DNA repair exonuclease SbcCD ATPase subunit
MERLVRFLRAELEYGCHRGTFEFPRSDGPVVLVGPNGAGKTTLIEGMIRALYGFNRRSESARLEGRKPWWEAVTFRSAVVLAVGEERWRVDRDFVSGEVVLERLDPPGERWIGDGNPGASNAEAREYRSRLRDLIGIAERDGYESTAWVHQGDLIQTELGEHLLRVAAGGHGTVEEARERIQEKYRELTAEPIRAGGRRLPKPRPLDEIEERMRELREELLHAETAESRRGPLVQEQEEAEARLATVKREIDQLEWAHDPLADRRALEADAARIQERILPLESVIRDLGDSLQELKRAAGEWRRIEESGALYPDDFPERAALLRSLWPARDELRQERERQRAAVEATRIPTRIGPLTAGGVAIIGVVAVILGWHLPGITITVIALCVGGYLLWRRQRRAQERRHREELMHATEARLTEAERAVQEQVQGLPHAESLTPETLPDRRDRFARQRDARQALEDARSTVRPVVRRAAEVLGRDPGDNGAAEEVVRELEAALSAARNELAEKNLALQRAAAESLDLPEGVEPDPNVVRRALHTRREECDRLESKLRELHRRLVNEASPPESSIALRDRLESMQEEREGLSASADAYRRAYALLAEAYEEFRARDQERLVENVSARLFALTDGRLGPVEAAGALSDGHVQAHGRLVAPESPPLSYGEFHAVLLAIRLGASDFLAKEGLLPPLVIDEPFAHLDEERSADLWRLLCDIARSRQVIIATQSGLLLDHLGVEPDIRLERKPAAAAVSGADIV